MNFASCQKVAFAQTFKIVLVVLLCASPCHSLDCSGQELFDPTIYDFLQPWFGGIDQKHIDAAQPINDEWSGRLYTNVSFPGMEEFAVANLSLGAQSPDYPWSSVWLNKLVVMDGTFYLPSGNIPPHPQGDAFGNFCFLFALEELVKLSKLVKIPDLTMLIAAGDTPFVSSTQAGGLLPPIFSTSTSRTAFDIALPSCYQVYNPWGSFEPVFLKLVEEDAIPWEEKHNNVVGRFGPACAGDTGKVYNRRGEILNCPRVGLHNITHSEKNKHLKLVDVGLVDGADLDWTQLHGHAAKNLKRLNMVEQFAHKYVAVLDGRTNAFRAPLNLASNQVPMFVAGTTTQAFYSDALIPWKHYVPIARDSYEDIFATIEWLNKHSEFAHQIAIDGQNFAKKHLTENGRMCYMSNLLHKYAELLQFQPGSLKDFPKAVTLESAIEKLKDDVKTIHAQSEGRG